jgi:urea-proton symporter
MNILTQTQGYVFLILFGIVMFTITWLFARWKRYKTKSGFLVAERKVNWLLGGSSIAASWIWAPALFVSVQMAFEKGLPGIFWFTLPNAIALALFAFLGPKIREKFSQGFTLPQWIKARLGSKRVHKVYLVPYVFYQIMAITVQLFAGGSLVSLLTGISLLKIMPLLLIIALAYALVSGLEASIVTDLLQLATIFVGGLIIIPWTVAKAGGMSMVAAGLGGVTGQFTNIFDPGIAFSFGIVTAIGLIAGAISDQQYWQRTFAIQKKSIRKSFLVGAALFAVVPIALSLLGFLGANSALGISLPAGVDASMIGVATVAQLLPAWATMLFVVVLLAGLSSTLDSGLVAFASLYATDMAKYKKDERNVLSKELRQEPLTEEENLLKKKIDIKVIRQARWAMVGVGIVGLIIALAVIYIPNFGLQHLWWVFNTIAACVLVPTILSLYWSKLTAKGVFWGILVSFIVGIPLFIYGNIVGSATLTVFATLFIIAVSAIFCYSFPRKRLIVA